MEIQVDYLDKSDILVPKFNDTIYYKGTLQIHHLKRVGKSKVNFYYNSTYKKSSSLLRAVHYVLASFPDSDLEEIDKPSENEKDEPFTEAVDQYDAFEVTIGNKYWSNYCSSFVPIKKKTIEIFRSGSIYSSNCVPFQFLKHSGEKIFSIKDGDFDDFSCRHIKAVIKDGQFTLNTCG